MTEKVACSQCGTLILPSTAARTGGLCMPCNSGTREAIEASKRRAVEERERDRTDPFRLYWISLVKRVYASESGFLTLSEPERLYFAVSCLEGDVYNGGFHQYFYNHSSAHYDLVLNGLAQLDALGHRALLERAKDILFHNAAVPVDTSERRELLLATSTSETEPLLVPLEREFLNAPHDLGSQLREFALRHHLVVGAWSDVAPDRSGGTLPELP